MLLMMQNNLRSDYMAKQKQHPFASAAGSCCGYSTTSEAHVHMLAMILAMISQSLAH